MDGLANRSRSDASTNCRDFATTRRAQIGRLQGGLFWLRGAIVFLLLAGCKTAPVVPHPKTAAADLSFTKTRSATSVGETESPSSADPKPSRESKPSREQDAAGSPTGAKSVSESRLSGTPTETRPEAPTGVHLVTDPRGTYLSVPGPLAFVHWWAPPADVKPHVDALAEFLKAHPEIQLVRIEVWTNPNKRRLKAELENTQIRADALFAHLWVRKHIHPERLEAVGRGPWPQQGLESLPGLGPPVASKVVRGIRYRVRIVVVQRRADGDSRSRP